MILLPDAAAAKDLRYRFNIPRGTLVSALAAVSDRAGISIGGAGNMPPIITPTVRGSMTVTEVLRRLLAGSGLKAVAMGPSVYRIAPDLSPTASAAQPKPRISPMAVTPDAPDDIIVTSQKRRQNLDDVAMSIAVVPLSQTMPGAMISGSRGISLVSDGLALTNLGAGLNRQFIRGVSDSPFNGPSQSTVAVQLDDARVTFNAPDPDLRLVDMQQVEILKGPQGPLYGSGALGGIFHIVTNKPNLTRAGGSTRLIGEAIAHGGSGGGAEAVANIPIVPDRLAVRAVGYVAHWGGWIDNVGARANDNRQQTTGGRIAMRWQPDPGWTIDLSALLQDTNSRNSQYVTASTTPLSRSMTIAEPADNDFKTIAITVQGHVGTLNLVATSSHVDHRISYALDSSAASPAFNLSGPSLFRSNRQYWITNHEIRISPTHQSAWLAGLAFMRARSQIVSTIETPTKALTVETLNRDVLEYALFGEATLPVSRGLDAVVGARLLHSQTHDEAIEQATGASDTLAKTIFSPSLSLRWRAADDTKVYLRYARSLRPGGLAPADQNASGQFDSDDIGTIDLGLRHRAPGSALSVGASVYYTIWNHIQSDYLLLNGLVSTRNAGQGRIYGLEASLDWKPVQRVTISAGLNYVHARLVSTEIGVTVEDRHLPITPDITGRLAGQYDFRLGQWDSSISGRLNYFGQSNLSFDDRLTGHVGRYGVAAATASFRRGPLSISATIDNMFDSTANSFAFGNPFSISLAPQQTPLRPRSFTMAITRSW